MFVFGYVLQRGIIARASHGRDENILLVTLGLSIAMENLALFFFKSDTRIIDTPYSFETVEILGAFLPVPKLVAFAGAIVTATLLWLLMTRTDLGRAIRALSKERKGAKLVGIDADHVFGVSFGLGIACLGVAACLLLPGYYVSPQVGGGFVLIAFTIVVLGGMGSFVGAMIGGLIIGVVEALSGLVPWREPGADRHFPDLHRRSDPEADRPARSQGVTRCGSWRSCWRYSGRLPWRR